MEPQVRKRRRNWRRRPSRGTRKAMKLGLIVTGALVLLAAGVVAAVAYFHEAPEPRLLGTWHSDADATIALRKKTQAVTDAQERAMRNIFGKMTVTYGEATLSVDFGDGTSDTQPYRVINRDAESVAVSWLWKPTNKEEIFLIFFESPDVYWLELPGFKMRECFRRVR